MSVWLCGRCGRSLAVEDCPACGSDPVVDASKPEFREVVERALDARRAKWRRLGYAGGGLFSLATLAVWIAGVVALQMAQTWLVVALAAPGLLLALGWVGVLASEGGDLAAWVLGTPRQDLNAAESLAEGVGLLIRLDRSDDWPLLWPITAGGRLGERFGRWIDPPPSPR